MKRGDKKGSHVGMMLSFVIFVTFLVFLYSALQPAIRIGQNKESIVDSLKVNILNNLSSDLIEITLTTDDAPQDCVKLQGFLNEIEINSKIIVKNKNKELLDFHISGNNLKIKRNDGSNLFFKIYHSKEFEDVQGTSINPCIPEDYVIGLMNNKSYIFEQKITDFIESYNSDYDSLKTELKVPERNEFGFSFINNTGTETSVGEENIMTSVYTEKIPIFYVDANANVLLGFITIKVW